MPLSTAKSFQSCPTLCDPIDGSPPGSPIPGILQARTLEWVAISFSNAWKWKVKGKLLSHFRPSVTPWSAAFQAPPSMGFSRQEYWSGVPLPSLPFSTRSFLMSFKHDRKAAVKQNKKMKLCCTNISLQWQFCLFVPLTANRIVISTYNVLSLSFKNG